ncbi:565_t:CDS:1, partial [Entrophospora sp. SA101]
KQESIENKAKFAKLENEKADLELEISKLKTAFEKYENGGKEKTSLELEISKLNVFHHEKLEKVEKEKAALELEISKLKVGYDEKLENIEKEKISLELEISKLKQEYETLLDKCQPMVEFEESNSDDINNSSISDDSINLIYIRQIEELKEELEKIKQQNDLLSKNNKYKERTRREDDKIINNGNLLLPASSTTNQSSPDQFSSNQNCYSPTEELNDPITDNNNIVSISPVTSSDIMIAHSQRINATIQTATLIKRATLTTPLNSTTLIPNSTNNNNELNNSSPSQSLQSLSSTPPSSNIPSYQTY